MTGRPETSGASKEGEAIGAPDEHGKHAGIKRHQKRGELLCDQCRDFQRSYNREYAQVRLKSAVFRARRNAARKQWERRMRTDPARVAAMNARRRQQWREARVREIRDARQLVDEVAVRRAVAGEPADLNRPERLAAVRQLRARGTTHRDIAARLKITARQVHRDLADLGLINTTTGAAA